MPVHRYASMQPEMVRDDLQRRLCHTGNLMTVVLDFSDGPWSEPEPPHQHPHVQTCYIAEGEITFYCEGEPDEDLQAGDMFSVPPGKLHSIKLRSETARLIDNFNPIREDFL